MVREGLGAPRRSGPLDFVAHVLPRDRYCRHCHADIISTPMVNNVSEMIDSEEEAKMWRCFARVYSQEVRLPDYKLISQCMGPGTHTHTHTHTHTRSRACVTRTTTVPADAQPAAWPPHADRVHARRMAPLTDGAVQAGDGQDRRDRPEAPSVCRHPVLVSRRASGLCFQHRHLGSI
jgi:hypothetical protein